MELSLSQRIIRSKKPFFLYHTYSVTDESLSRAIAENKSMDLDVCIDENGNPYIGHSQEFYKISGEKQPLCLPLWEAVERIAQARILVIVDCKHHDAWPLVEEVITKIGAHKCLVHTYASELKFDYHFYDHDYPTEWSPIRTLSSLKGKFPNVTTTASCKFLPEDFLLSEEYRGDWISIRDILHKNQVDTVCLNVPDKTVSNKTLDFFLEGGILPHINVDGIDLSEISSPFVGETNVLDTASRAEELGY